MIPPDVITAITAIHAAPQQLVLAFTGAGSQALYWLHGVAGSSRTVLAAIDAYSPPALAELLVGVPMERAVSRSTALGMATWALARAEQLGGPVTPVIGIGCTAAIATERERRGMNRCIIAISSTNRFNYTSDRRAYYELVMHKGRRERLAEEELCSRLIIRAIALACAVPPPDLIVETDEQLIEEDV
jgi:hypothetical protein